MEGYAQRPSGAPDKSLSVWADGVSFTSDGAEMCDYILEEGQKYRVTVEMIPNDYCGDEEK
jgi:hypothetical protein